MKPEESKTLTPVPGTNHIWKGLTLPVGLVLYSDFAKTRYIVMHGQTVVASRTRSVVDGWRQPGKTLSSVVRLALHRKPILDN